jgi:hypothetical protein
LLTDLLRSVSVENSNDGISSKRGNKNWIETQDHITVHVKVRKVIEHTVFLMIVDQVLIWVQNMSIEEGEHLVTRLLDKK